MQDDAVAAAEEEAGRVNRLRQNFAMYADGALASRLQSEEISAHLRGNKERNHLIRADVPYAKATYASEVDRIHEEARRRHAEAEALTEHDARLAAALADDFSVSEREHRQYEAARDEAFARRIQRLEHQQLQRREVSSSSSASTSASSSTTYSASSVRPVRTEASATPTLPTTDDGDVPYDEDEELAGAAALPPATAGKDNTFHDICGGIRYNDDQYLVKMARPAMIKAEPVYANGRPEHYAVSNPFSAEASASSDEMLGAMGLSQRDIALSRRAEQQLEQERRDQELARRLQEQLMAEDQKTAMKEELEAKDREVARALYEKERAKLKRAKERSRQKKLEQQRQQQERSPGDDRPVEEEPEQPRSLSPPPSEPRTSSRSSRRSAESSVHNQSATEPRSTPVPSEVDAVLPARRPLMNRQAIDSYPISGFEEPQYENLRPRPPLATPLPSSSLGSPFRPTCQDTPVPPYMPMQQTSSKKSSSMEKRINKKKEKEGCKQQ